MSRTNRALAVVAALLGGVGVSFALLVWLDVLVAAAGR